MIKGMTGFGSAEFSSKDIKGIIEIKSLNHRYLDIAYFLPPGFASLEEKIRQALQKRIARGRITVSMKILKKGAPKVVFNKEVVGAYLKNERAIKKEFRLAGDITLRDIIRMPGVIEVQESDMQPVLLSTMVEKGLKKALDSLALMREREGKSIAQDVKSQTSRMSMKIKKIHSREKQILSEAKKRMSTEEFEMFQKSIDVNEEISRLTHHIKEFSLLVDSNAAAGKKLDFIAQEMQRETNTIGAKAPDKIISSLVVALKSNIEKLREQAQNIE